MSFEIFFFFLVGEFFCFTVYFLLEVCCGFKKVVKILLEVREDREKNFIKMNLVLRMKIR